MSAVFLDRASLDFGDVALSRLEAITELRCFDQTTPHQVVARLQGVEIAIVNKVVLDAAVLDQLPALRLICVAATGTNNVDLDGAARRGIAVSNCQGYGTASVAQHTLALMLALATRLFSYQQAVARGEWQRSAQFCLLDYPSMELSGKTLGIVGYGELGQQVARLAAALGMRVLVAARPGSQPAGDRLALDALLPQVDVLTLHCPLTEQTRGLIGRSALRRMKPGALLINAARGGIVDEEALREALCSGHLGGAGVDVLSQEPPHQGNPLLDDSIPNLILTPQCAWGSREARQTIVNQMAENIAAYGRGEALRRV